MTTKLNRWTVTAAALAMTLATAGSGAAAALPHTTSPTATASTTTQEPEPETATVEGAGGGVLQTGLFTGDRVSFHVDAAAPSAKPWLATGTFEVTHLRADGSLLSKFGGDVSCLMASNGVAVATGTVSWTEGPGLPTQDPSGVRVGLTIQDHGRRDQLGWSWWVMGFRDVPHCMSTAPFFPVSEGNFRVDAPHVAPGQPTSDESTVSR
jgi:hypothetical protein